MARKPKKKVRERDLDPDELARRYADAVTPSKKRIDRLISTVSSPGFFDGPDVDGEHIGTEHIGKRDAYLADRALQVTSKHVASTFPNAKLAKEAVKLVLSRNAELVCKWLADQDTTGTVRVRSLLSDKVVDRLADKGMSMVSVRRDDATGLYRRYRCSAIEMVLRKVPKIEKDDLGFEVVTCYPEAEPDRDFEAPEPAESYELDEAVNIGRKTVIPKPTVIPYGVLASTQAFSSISESRRERIERAYRSDAAGRMLDAADVPWFLDPHIDARGDITLCDATTGFVACLSPAPDMWTNAEAPCVIELTQHGKSLGRTVKYAEEISTAIEQIVNRDRTLRDAKLNSDLVREAATVDRQAANMANIEFE